MTTITRAQAKAARLQACELMDKHCRSCERLNQSQYCLQKCEIGKQLKSIGDKLGTEVEDSKGGVRTKQPVLLTREQYIEYKKQGLRDEQIAYKTNLAKKRISDLRKQWGVTGTRVVRRTE